MRPPSSSKFPEGFYLKTSDRRIPAAGISGTMVDDSLVVSESGDRGRSERLPWFQSVQRQQCAADAHLTPVEILSICWADSMPGVFTSGMATLLDSPANSASEPKLHLVCPDSAASSLAQWSLCGPECAGMWRLRGQQLAVGDSGTALGVGAGVQQSGAGRHCLRIDSRVRAVYRLSQNYPNQFNSATVIRVEWPVASRVKLAVYDILGREVAVC